MAANTNISIKDETSARKWLQEVQTINQDYKVAIQDAGDTLYQMKDFADGTLVDDFVDMGSKILTAAESTYEAIDSIAGTVNTILDAVKNFTEDIVGGIAGAVRTIFG